jgi:hypothetical protein
MNRLNIEPIAEGNIRVEIVDDGPSLAVNFIGEIDMQDPSSLFDPLFTKLHEGLVALKIPTVTADFRALAFLNSSGIKAIAKWIMKLAILPPDQKYQIRLIHNRKISWQATSLPTLTFLVPGAVRVE